MSKSRSENKIPISFTLDPGAIEKLEPARAAIGVRSCAAVVNILVSAIDVEGTQSKHILCIHDRFGVLKVNAELANEETHGQA
jgi:hypothetical protein